MISGLIHSDRVYTPRQLAVAKIIGACACLTYHQPGAWETAICDGCGKNPYYADHALPIYEHDLNVVRRLEKDFIQGKHDDVYFKLLAKPAIEFDENNGNCLDQQAYVACCTYADAQERIDAFIATLS